MHFFDTLYLLVTFLLSVRKCASVRVDWNTNKGPIIPPTPHTTQRPQLPYREPAPVWEDQSNDIPNPNPYVYVLPPPSRPRPATNNYLTADRRPVTQEENYHLYNYENNYGKLLPPVANAANFYQNGNSVAGIAAKYVPNIGFKYFAIVPNNINNNNNNGKSIQQQHTELSNGYYTANDKVQGKYNPKTKKYKAFEKVKYVPPNYYPFFEFALPEASPYVPIFDEKKFLSTQQLPAIVTEMPFHEKQFMKEMPANERPAAASDQQQFKQIQLNQFKQEQRPKIVHTKVTEVTKENFGKFMENFSFNNLHKSTAQQSKYRESSHNDRIGYGT